LTLYQLKTIHWNCYSLTPKVPWLCSFHQKRSKTTISNTSNKFSKKTLFSTHVTLGSFRMLTWEHEKKNFRNFHWVGCKILACDLTIILFLALRKTGQLHFTRLNFHEKMSKIVVLLCIQSSSQVNYMLEKFQIIWNCTTYRKKIVSRKK